MLTKSEADKVVARVRSDVRKYMGTSYAWDITGEACDLRVRTTAMTLHGRIPAGTEVRAVVALHGDWVDGWVVEWDGALHEVGVDEAKAI